MTPPELSPPGNAAPAGSTQMVGKAVERADARLKVTGKAAYAAEVPVANLAYALIVTSSVGRGRLKSLDTSRAQASPGVLHIFTPDNCPKLPGAAAKLDDTDRVMQLLQDDRILYNDQPIALVVADSLEHAQGAAHWLEPQYLSEPLTAVLARNAKDSYTPKAAGPRGKTNSQRGDAKAHFEQAPVRVDQVYTTPVQNHHPMEMHGLTVAWQGRDHITLYDTSQGIFGARKKVASVFQLPVENVRVISHYVGGGFGSKGSPWSHVALAALAARELMRPVRLVLTRQQMCSLVGHRPSTIQRVFLGADRNGKLLAMGHESLSETSRFDEFVEPCALQTRMLYQCANVSTSHRVARLDIPTPTFMRAPGESTGTFALECAMDELAGELRLDPLELRLRNYAEQDPDENKPFSSKSLKQCYLSAAKSFGWERRSAAPGSMRDGRWLLGWGMATATYPALQRESSARARLLTNGQILVQAGSQDLGTGTYTIMAQIAADELGVGVERVRFELGDTTLPETPVSGGSMTAASTGSAVRAAAGALKNKLQQLALSNAHSPLHGAAPESVELRAGVFLNRAQPAQQWSFSDLARASNEAELSATATADRKDKAHSFHSFGAQFVALRVDPYTFEVRLTRVVSAFAAGKILNPRTARSQFLGGIVWGIGFALHEQTLRDPRNGRIVTRDLADYHVPVHADIPPIEVIMLDEADPYVSAVGAKGIGEIGITGISAAIANAVYHATGKRVRDLPITPEKLV